MHPNIKKLYMLNFLTGIVFWYPIEKLFLRHIGIDDFGIGINAAVYAAVVVLLDVPFGALADRHQRRMIMTAALACLGVSSIFGALSHSLVTYLICSLFFGLYVVLSSGAYQAMMYDSLKDSGHEGRYDHFQGRAYALFLTGIGVSSLIGGYMAEFLGYRATYWASGISMILAIVISLRLTEPRSHKPVFDVHFREHLKRSFHLIVNRSIVLQLGLMLVAITVLRNSQNEYAGLLYLALGLTAIPTGYANAAKWLSGAVGQLVAPRIGRRALSYAPLLFFVFACIGLLHSRWVFIPFFGAILLHGIIANQTEAELQSHFPSEYRATLLSITSFSTNVILIPLGLAFGWVSRQSSAFTAYWYIGVLGILYLAYWFVAVRQKVS